MSARELLYGERHEAEFVQPSSRIDVSSTETLALADVEIAYSLFEIPMATLVSALPVSLHPSIPAVLATSFWRVPTSPFGAFNFSYVGLACRTGIKPRHMVVQAWCDNLQASAYLRDRYGFDCAQAEVRCHESYERVQGQVSVEGVVMLDITITDCVPIVSGGGSVKYSPPLSLTTINDRVGFAQFEAGYSFKRVLRGPVKAKTFAVAAPGKVSIQPTYSVAGTFAVCDVELFPVRFVVDLVRPAEDGGASKVVR